MLQKLLILTVLIFNFSVTHAYPTRPNPVETQGERCNQNDSDFKEFRYNEQIPYCIRNVDSRKKTQIYDAYRIPVECRHRYTIDHFLPLSIGGNNSDFNLWPEHKLVKATRPKLEIELYNSIKNGLITQEEAIKIIKNEKMKAMASLISAQKETEIENNCDKIDTISE
jgi:hypothetical protein